MLKTIEKHLANHNLDVRKTKDARFMDQKVTPDVLCAVSECVVEFKKSGSKKKFTKNDIWYSKFSQELITNSFNKPNLKDAQNEYDKFFSQPLKTLAYAKVLNEEKIGVSNYYTINNYEILEYISLRERNSLNFLYLYLTKVITDSNLLGYFENFFHNQNKNSLKLLRENLFDFFYTYTSIKKKYEPPRIFNKIINIIAFKRKLKGTIGGAVSNIVIPIEEIRYNRINWRDFGKDKLLTREQFNITLTGNMAISGYYKYNIQKAKRFVRKIHQYSEIHRFKEYPGLQAHHIFPVNEYPELADLPENIICLTPNQHLLRAHPNNKTSIIDSGYQFVCLISKLDSIEISYRLENDYYSLEDFVNVLNLGLETENFETKMDFEEIKHQIIKYCYNGKVVM